MKAFEDKFQPGDLVQFSSEVLDSLHWNNPEIAKQAVGIVVARDASVFPHSPEETYEVHWLGSNSRRKFNYHYELEHARKGNAHD